MSETPAEPVNVAEGLWRIAAELPDELAVGVDRTGARCTFAELRDRVSALASSLGRLGVGEGDPVVVMLRPGIDFMVSAFAVVAIGASVVVVDPGLGLRRMMRAFATIPARAVIAERLFHFLSLPFRPFESGVTRISRGWWPGARTLETLTRETSDFVPVRTAKPAILAFTSGATGRPKSVVMGHEALGAQIDAIRSMAKVGRGDTQVAFLPLAALMGPALECATLFPDISLQRLDSLKGERVVDAIRRWGATHAIASPFVWRRVAEHLSQAPEELSTLEHVFVGGAPARRALLQELRELLPSAVVHVGYGSTEVVPISSAETPLDQGPGAPVGSPVEGLQVKVVRRFGAQVRTLEQCEELADREIGEFIVSGRLVAEGYGDASATAIARIEGAGRTWHRTGDVGYIADGQLWLCGRADEVVQTASATLYPGIVEPVFETSPAIDRAVLVGVGEVPQIPVIVVVPTGEQGRALAAGREIARTSWERGELDVQIDAVLVRRDVPLDSRHRSKVLRNEVARWAASKVARGALEREER